MLPCSIPAFSRALSSDPVNLPGRRGAPAEPIACAGLLILAPRPRWLPRERSSLASSHCYAAPCARSRLRRRRHARGRPSRAPHVGSNPRSPRRSARFAAFLIDGFRRSRLVRACSGTSSERMRSSATSSRPRRYGLRREVPGRISILPGKKRPFRAVIAATLEPRVYELEGICGSRHPGATAISRRRGGRRSIRWAAARPGSP